MALPTHAVAVLAALAAHAALMLLALLALLGCRPGPGEAGGVAFRPVRLAPLWVLRAGLGQLAGYGAVAALASGSPFFFSNFSKSTIHSRSNPRFPVLVSIHYG